MDPFSSQVKKDALLNIATRQAVSDEVADFHLNVENIGEDMRKKIIIKCSKNKDNFQKFVVMGHMILNFASCAKKRKVTIAGKVQEAKVQQDLFGRLLGISLSSQGILDIDEVLFLICISVCSSCSYYIVLVQ
ncbi:hypothetical protein JTB14_022199 [Gonioctena quinquepunctata]|nr:hypothetical protein JTB14_022199 [Gonioctena quinquepunctata]